MQVDGAKACPKPTYATDDDADFENQHAREKAVASSGEEWRDHIRVHPAADEYPMMPEYELKALAADIEKRGLQQSIVWLGDELLDGRNRIAAVYRMRDERRRDAILKGWEKGKGCIVLLKPSRIGLIRSTIDALKVRHEEVMSVRMPKADITVDEALKAIELAVRKSPASINGHWLVNLGRQAIIHAYAAARK